MGYLPTLKACAEDELTRIRLGAAMLTSDAEHLGCDIERRDFRLAAAAGARAYAGLLEKAIKDNDIDVDVLNQADLVSRAAQCKGWLSARSVDAVNAAEMRSLTKLGIFAYFPEGNGWAACYRLVAS